MSIPTTTARPSAVAGGGGAGAVLALARTEIRLLVRNRTAAFSAVLFPPVFGVFFGLQISSGAEDWSPWGLVLALQLSFAFGLTVYTTVTQTVVARRQTGVLKRMRTSSLTDNGILAAITAPAVAVTVVHLAIFLVADPILGAPAPVDLLSLVLALVAGFALSVAAAFATSIVTSTAERGQITTMPLFMLFVAAAVVAPALPMDTPFAAVTLVPGASVGAFAGFAMNGGAFDAGFLGLPALTAPLVGLVVWPIVFLLAARPRFRWDPRL